MTQKCIKIVVEGVPPTKDGSMSILGTEHSQHGRVVLLRNAMDNAMNGREPAEVNCRMEVHYCRVKTKRGDLRDALNMINGISDSIQEKNAMTTIPHNYAIKDDKCIREFHYTECGSDKDSYTVLITPLENG